MSVPGVGDDDVVEGRMTLAEAREADFENHGRTIFGLLQGSCVSSKDCSIAETIWWSAAAKDDFRDEGTSAKNSHPQWLHAAKSLHFFLLHIPCTVTLPFTLVYCLSASILSIT